MQSKKERQIAYLAGQQSRDGDIVEQPALSLDALPHDTLDDAASRELMRAELRADVQALLNSLPDALRQYILERFEGLNLDETVTGHDVSYAALAEHFGCNREQAVHRVERALYMIRARYMSHLADY